jgi:hypothetical protein
MARHASPWQAFLMHASRPDPIRRAGLRLVASGLALAAAPAWAAEPGSFCDPSLPRLDDNPHGYRMRGERCEGVYVREVAGDELRIASFTRWIGDFDPGRGGTLPIEWATAPGDGSLRLRAQGLARRSHYRMDTVRAIAGGRWAWPLDVLAARGMGRGDIGLLGRTRAEIAGRSRELLVPLRVGPRPAGALSPGYSLVVLPQLEFSALFLRVEAVDASGNARGAAGEARELGLGYYPAERAVDIVVDAATSGLHRLELAAVFRQGGSTTLETWFHHPGA